MYFVLGIGDFFDAIANWFAELIGWVMLIPNVLISQVNSVLSVISLLPTMLGISPSIQVAFPVCVTVLVSVCCSIAIIKIIIPGQLGGDK